LTASLFTEFHKKLAQEILPYISKHDTVCDFGCGLGRLDIELSSGVKHITSVDIEEKVIHILEEDIKSVGIANMEARCVNAIHIREKFDIGIMSFFGKSGGDMCFYRNLCRKKLIRIANVENDSTLYPKEHRKTRKDVAQDIRRDLYRNNMEFEYKDVYIEFGQPLSSKEEARMFIQSHAPKADEKEVDLFLEKNTILTKREDYPIYLPNLKHIGIFIIS
jgi:predicted RNA methylase